MSQSNYLDELDNLFDNPTQAEKDQLQPTSTMEINPVATDPLSTNEAEGASVAARETWAKIIENASKALNDGSVLTQEAAQKNIELAKTQQETIKELIDASSGWRHATRQAVQEVNAAKKNVITLTVISAVIAVAGFGTTIGVMLQSRSGLITMSNTVLENVDEHQSLVSKTLTIKMDELTSTIEQMQSVLDQLAQQDQQPSANQTTTQNTLSLPTTDTATSLVATPEAINTPPTTETNTTTNDDKKSVNKTTPAATMTTTATPSPTTTTPEPATTLAEVSTNEVTTQQLQKMSDQLQALQQQLSSMETNLPIATEALNQNMQTLNAQLEAKLSARLAQSNTPMTTPAAVETAKPTVIHDNKPILDQLNRLRQDIAEIRTMQTVLKDQLLQLKQSKSDVKPYQYRTTPDEIEAYPR